MLDIRFRNFYGHVDALTLRVQSKFICGHIAGKFNFAQEGRFSLPNTPKVAANTYPPAPVLPFQRYQFLVGFRLPRGSAMPLFVFRANIDHYLELLNDADFPTERRATVVKLLIAEEDKLSAA